MKAYLERFNDLWRGLLIRWSISLATALFAPYMVQLGAASTMICAFFRRGDKIKAIFTMRAISNYRYYSRHSCITELCTGSEYMVDRNAEST